MALASSGWDVNWSRTRNSSGGWVFLHHNASQIAGDAWQCHVRFESQSLLILREDCGGKIPLTLPWALGKRSLPWLSTAHHRGFLSWVVQHYIAYFKGESSCSHLWKIQSSSQTWLEQNYGGWQTSCASLPEVSSICRVVGNAVSHTCLNHDLLRIFLAVKPDCGLTREKKKLYMGGSGGTRAHKTSSQENGSERCVFHSPYGWRLFGAKSLGKATCRLMLVGSMHVLQTLSRVSNKYAQALGRLRPLSRCRSTVMYHGGGVNRAANNHL